MRITSREQILQIEGLALAGDFSGSYQLGNWQYTIESDEGVVERVLGVLRTISSVDSTRWSEVQSWRQQLPKWLLLNTPNIPREEAEQIMASVPREDWANLPWDFESWLDSLRDRAWYFVGVMREGGVTQFRLFLTSFPANLDTFAHILQSAGAKIMNFSDLERI